MAGEVSVEHIYQEEVYRALPPPTVVLPCPWSEVDEDVRQSLSKILKALGPSLEGVRIIHQKTFDLSVYVEKPRRIIVFLQPPKGLSLYERHDTGNSAVVFGGGFEVLTADEVTKRKFWSALQGLFSV